MSDAKLELEVHSRPLLPSGTLLAIILGALILFLLVCISTTCIELLLIKS